MTSRERERAEDLGKVGQCHKSIRFWTFSYGQKEARGAFKKLINFA